MWASPESQLWIFNVMRLMMVNRDISLVKWLLDGKNNVSVVTDYLTDKTMQAAKNRMMMLQSMKEYLAHFPVRIEVFITNDVKNTFVRTIVDSNVLVRITIHNQSNCKACMIMLWIHKRRRIPCHLGKLWGVSREYFTEHLPWYKWTTLYNHYGFEVFASSVFSNCVTMLWL